MKGVSLKEIHEISQAYQKRYLGLEIVQMMTKVMMKTGETASCTFYQNAEKYYGEVNAIILNCSYFDDYTEQLIIGYQIRLVASQTELVQDMFDILGYQGDFKHIEVSWDNNGIMYCTLNTHINMLPERGLASKHNLYIPF